MKVAVRNNSLREAIRLIGAAETGSLFSYLLRLMPGGVFETLPQTDLYIKSKYALGVFQITIAASGAFMFDFEMPVPRAVASRVRMLEFNGIISGLVYTALGRMPINRTGDRALMLFDWEERPDSPPANVIDGLNPLWDGTVKPSYGPVQFVDYSWSEAIISKVSQGINYPSVSMVDYDKTINNLMYWISSDGLTFSVGADPVAKVEEYRYEEATLHQRNVNI